MLREGHGDDFFSVRMESWVADLDVIIEIQKVPELVQGLFVLGVSYFRHVFIFILFNKHT